MKVRFPIWAKAHKTQVYRRPIFEWKSKSGMTLLHYCSLIMQFWPPAELFRSTKPGRWDPERGGAPTLRGLKPGPMMGPASVCMENKWVPARFTSFCSWKGYDNDFVSKISIFICKMYQGRSPWALVTSLSFPSSVPVNPRPAGLRYSATRDARPLPQVAPAAVAAKLGPVHTWRFHLLVRSSLEMVTFLCPCAS